mmetsp:Transcript_35240/g.76061  ORF Transcript_35240/g.76061 Transcript_35240/m.76061 type:complete len:705 (+) Transcript_35240:370-2484(+)
MEKKQFNANEYYPGRQNQLDEETPAHLNFNNHSHRGEDRLFHLQQELLREELSQQRWREAQYNQSQRLEQSLQQEELMWQRRHQVRQGDTSRESTTSEHGEWEMEMGGGRREMGGSFNLDNIYSNNGDFSSPIMRSDAPLRLLTGRTLREQRDVDFSCYSRVQSNHSNSIGKEGQLSAQRSRSTGSLRTVSGTSNNNGNSNIAARGSYHDECSTRNHSKQYFDARSSSNNQSPDILPFQPSRSDRGEATFAFQHNAFDPKRRRLNFHHGQPTSNEKLVLKMLTDTVVSPTTTKKIHAQSLVADIADSEHDTIDKPALMDGSVLSPFSRYIKPILHENASLTPLPQSRGNGYIGNTHRMFAEFLLDSISGGSGGGLDVSAMPPPPLVHNIDFGNKIRSEGSNVQPAEKSALKSGETADVALLSQACDSLDPLPLPRRKSQQRNFPHGKKKPSRGKGQKKSKDGTASSSSDPTSNYIITPSSATISALSAEVRLKMKPSFIQDRNVANSARSDGKDSNSSDVFSIPNFASAMETSQASQQAIHDWDRKFGLRRAHSKTMRESCRSRKKVLEFLKGGGANLLLWKKSSSSGESSGLRASGNSTVVASPPFGEEEEERGVFQELDNANGILHNAKLEQDQAHNITECTPSTKNETGGECGLKVDVQLEQMFRRASLDSTKYMLPGEIIAGIPSPPQEADRKQFHAKSA